MVLWKTTAHVGGGAEFAPPFQMALTVPVPDVSAAMVFVMSRWNVCDPEAESVNVEELEV